MPWLLLSDATVPSLPICQDIDYFVGWMGLLEKDSQKWKKITDLELTKSEWNRVKLLLDLLSVSC